MKKLLLLLFLPLSSCGIEGPSSTISLFAPNGLRVTYTQSTKTYTVMFDALNPESGFSGYNLYYTRDLATAEIGQGERVILKGTVASTLDPTFTINRPFFTVQTFTFPLNEDKMPDVFFDAAFTPSDFYFILRSYDRSAARESVSSLYFRTIVVP